MGMPLTVGVGRVGLVLSAPLIVPSFDPLSLSPVLWLKADTGLYTTSGGSTAATADGDPVGRWEDQSGHAYHASQGTASQRGTLKLAQVNGRAAVLYDGVDDLHTLASPISLTDFTILAVVRPILPADGSDHVLLADNTSGAYLMDLEGTNSVIYNNFGTSQKSINNAYANNTWQLLEQQRSGANWSIFRNGSQQGTAQNSGTGSTTLGEISGRNGSPTLVINMYLAELFAFSSVPSADSLTSLRAYLNSRYALY